jgi:SP family xylose:H+ symportor-like MFS transporter
MITGIILAVFQQWCGINVIFNYAQEIFASAGFDRLLTIIMYGMGNLPERLLRIAR